VKPSEVVVYVGTSLSHADAAALLPGVSYRPPIARGDLDALGEEIKLVAIVDGVFHQSLPVAPFEVKRALLRGVKVFGAASMGALRAVELAPLGMVGVGTVYQWYRDGVVTSDHEVALKFDPDTLRCLSVPLVNIRYALQRAAQENALSADASAALLKQAQSLHYTDLTYPHLLRAAPDALIPAGHDRRSLAAYLETFDLKRDDARLCLQAVGSFLANAP
jgi:ribosomal protein S12 methylthiotransferase accessory factor